VRWPNGKTEILHDVMADAIYTISEGEGIKDTKPLPPVNDKNAVNAAKGK
jgi:hypothetical protein